MNVDKGSMKYFKYGRCPNNCRQYYNLKHVVKKLADDFGLFATFMPKPVEGIGWSGMHLNMSLFKDGKNIFYDESKENKLSDEVMYFIENT